MKSVFKYLKPYYALLSAWLAPLIARFLQKDHALASLTSTLVLVGMVADELLPLLPMLRLSPVDVELGVMICTCLITMAGVVREVKVLTLASVLALLTQILSILAEHKVGEGGKLGIYLVVVSALVKVLARFTTAGSFGGHYGVHDEPDQDNDPPRIDPREMMPIPGAQ